MSDFLQQAFIYLCATAVALPVARLLGLGSVLGYLIAGVIIGPITGLVGAEAQTLQHFGEFGVVMMLFLVGLEMEPKNLWKMRRRFLTLGGAQMGLTMLGITLLALLLNFELRAAVVMGMIFSLSSTAIVLQTLKEKKLMKSEGGRSCLSVLIFQDIAVIPILVIIPLLAAPALLEELGGSGGKQIMGMDLSGWAVALTNLAAVSAVILSGRYLSSSLFQFVALARLREAFTATALLIVIAIALLMEYVGLSPALGAFIAGVVLANSEFRHELENSIDPFKGLLLGLFFITVGANINFEVLVREWQIILNLTVSLTALKIIVLLLVAKIFKFKKDSRWLFSLGLAQAGEFTFVLVPLAVKYAVLSSDLAQALLLVAGLSMLLTPALFIFYERGILQIFSERNKPAAADAAIEEGEVIIVGHGRFGQIINRLLRASGYEPVVFDYQAGIIKEAKKFGMNPFYGDANRFDMLQQAGLHKAQLLVVVIDDTESALKLVRYARKQHPDIHIIARARDQRAAYSLYKGGANDIIRETFDSAVRAGSCALEALGIVNYEAKRITEVFIDRDTEAIRELATVWNPNIPSYKNKEYIKLASRLDKEIKEAVAQLQAPTKKEKESE